ncbi:MAG: type I methionyl aminopeptidase [Salibacteraceae bacterium]
MLKTKSEEEIALIRESSLLVGKTLGEVASMIQPGVTPLELDKRAFEFISDHGAVPGFLNFNGFPNSLCISKNEAVVHGIPNSKPVVEGDILSVDCGVLMNGYYGDSAYTFAVGEPSEEVANLMAVTKECLRKGIEQAVAGNRVGDIGFAVQQEAEKHGYGVVRELCGHGLGKGLHEPPEVPNFGRRGRGTKLVDGLVIAIEPMINLGTRNVKQLNDGWTIITGDRKPSAHYEHTLVVRQGKAEVLSTFEFVEEKLNVVA